MNNPVLFFALSLYSFWNVTIITERVSKYNVRKYSTRYFFDVFYFVIMMYYLTLSSTNFLFLSVMTIAAQILFGVYVEFFRPDLKARDMTIPNIMNSYWNYVILDSTVALSSFGLIFFGSL